jgi:hypothetical protein
MLSDEPLRTVAPRLEAANRVDERITHAKQVFCFAQPHIDPVLHETERSRVEWEVEAGSSVTEVAERFGVSRQAVHRW